MSDDVTAAAQVETAAARAETAATDAQAAAADAEAAAAEVKADTEQRLELMSKLRTEIQRRELSNTENYDKSVLSLATAFLGFSLAFLKDFVSYRSASCHLLLPLSWGLFGLAILATIASFLTSQEELAAQLVRAEAYYINKDEAALSRRSLWDNWTKGLNWSSAVTFVLGVISTIIFITVNLKEGTMPKHDDLGKAASVPPIQRIPGIGQDGALVPTVQRVPTPPTPGQGSGQTNSNSSNTGKK